MKIENLPADTRLDTLGIPELDVVLDEIFFIPTHSFIKDRPKTPQTIGELIAVSPVKPSKVVHLLKWVIELAKDCAITASDFKNTLALEDNDAIILDVRNEEGRKGREISGAVCTWTINWDEWIPKIKNSQNVIVICNEGKRSFSAAMQLRDELSITHTKYLAGGVSQLEQIK